MIAVLDGRCTIKLAALAFIGQECAIILKWQWGEVYV